MKKREAKVGDLIKWMKDGDVGVVIGIKRETGEMDVRWLYQDRLPDNESMETDIGILFEIYKYRVLEEEERMMELL